MRLAFLALALTYPAASSVLPAASPHRAAAQHRLDPSAMPSRLCSDAMKVRPAGSPDAAKARRLGELPPGELTLTVVDRVGDCIEPRVVRQGYGILGPDPGR